MKSPINRAKWTIEPKLYPYAVTHDLYLNFVQSAYHDMQSQLKYRHIKMFVLIDTQCFKELKYDENFIV